MRSERLTFWGVRGSTAVAGRRTVRYGGNTSCLHLECAGTHLICDAGTGIQPLGNALARRFRGKPLQACILLSHLHWDHYMGLPFFKPLFDKRHSFRIAGPGIGRTGFASLLNHAITPPYFPVRLSAYAAAIDLVTVRPRGMPWGGLEIAPIRANHPDGACGWRILLPQGPTVAVMTDDEPGDSNRLKELAADLQGVELLIHDAQYTPRSYPQKRGWGHSPYTYPIELAAEAGIRRLYLTHFDPDDDDAALDRRIIEARRYASSLGVGIRCSLAREGLTIPLGT